MVLSPAERAYIYDSLTSADVARTDSRKANQFRPLKASCSFLPNSNGSARIYTVDGLECIASVKAKVIRTKDLNELINVDIDIQGQRDDSSLGQNLSTLLTKSLIDRFDLKSLKLTDKYYFQLFIDLVILSIPSDFHLSSYTLYSLLSLTSMGTYLALKSTRLPLLISTTNDREIEEEPSFADDWDLSTYLIPQNSIFTPTLLFVVGIVGNNIIIDPSIEEEQVLENGLCVGFNSGKIVPPVQSIMLSTADGKGFSQTTMFKALDMVKGIGKEVAEALDTISEQEVDGFESIF